MRVRRAIFTWKRMYKDPIDFGNLDRIDVVFEEGKERPVLYIEAGRIKIEDGTLGVDCKEVLKKIGEIDFEKKIDINFPTELSKSVWELTINDKKYEGILEDPHYVLKVKRIIRFSYLQLYANKKLAGYIKA